MDQQYDWPFHNDEATVIQRYRDTVRRNPRIKVSRWSPVDHGGLGYWLRYLAHEPRDFAFTAPRRLACRLLGRHNISCHGRGRCPRFAPKALRVALQPGEYVLTRAAVARAAAPLPPLHDLCCGCSGNTCCACGEDPCCTS